MNGWWKLIFAWLAVIAGVCLVLISPINLNGAGLIAIGLVCLGFGLAPILRKRKQDREKEDDGTT